MKKLYLNVYDDGAVVRLHGSRADADHAAQDEIGDDRDACIETTLALISVGPEMLATCERIKQSLEDADAVHGTSHALELAKLEYIIKKAKEVWP